MLPSTRALFLLCAGLTLGACSFTSKKPSVSFQIENFELSAQKRAAHLIFAIKESAFLNKRNTKAPLLERAADWILSPVRYIFLGSDLGDGFERRSFIYDKSTLKTKTALSLFATPSSLLTGALLKACSRLLFGATPLSAPPALHLESTPARYTPMGLGQVFSAKHARCMHLPRGPFVYPEVSHDIEALRQITKILNFYSIPCWLDDGTCLGAYRHAGVIPWDYDVDISILKSDFERVLTALRELDPKKYWVQDWSGALSPKSYIRVQIEATGNLIDIYCYAFNKDKNTVRYVYALEDSLFVPKKWKDRERRLVKDIPLATLFPLKKMFFEGFEVNVPGQTQKWLHYKYGENLEPARIWDTLTNEYIKDSSHPYWQHSNI